MKYGISIKRMVEIEDEFLKSLREGNSRKDALCDVVINSKCFEEEIKYIMEAYQMPIEEIYDAIINGWPNSSLDVLEFQDELCRRYNVGRQTIMIRMENVIAIRNYIKRIAKQNETKDMDENDKRK